MSKLIPRLDYKYTIKDALIAFSGIFKKRIYKDSMNDYFQTNDIYFVNHARVGIRIAISALNLKQPAKIGVMAYNCKTVFNAIKVAGHIPVFLDVTDGFKIDLKDVEKRRGELDALVVTHLFGIPNEIDSIKALLPNVPIIEDCAHAFFSKDKEMLVGLKGDIGVFSFGKAKFPSVGDGGFIVVNNTNLTQKIETEVKNLSQQPIFRELNNIIKALILSFLFKPVVYGNFTLPYLKNLVAKNDLGGLYDHHEEAVLKTNLKLFLAKAKKMPFMASERKKNAFENIELFKNKLSIEDNIDFNLEGNNFMIPILISNGAKELISLYKTKGVELGQHFSKSLKAAKKFGYKENSCPNAETIPERIISIPTYYKIKV